MMLRTQETLDGEIIVDSFAGGGGASTGIELALGRIVNAAINHDPAAIRMHEANHPYTEHYQASVWDVDPETVCRGRPVALAWFSPDCKHFSKAKGAALVDRKIRGLAWIALRWAAKVRPRVIILENVEEFQTWGPVRKGKPVKKLAGTTFQKFVGQLRALGYTVEWRELVAADYGAPTTRRRLVLIARCDGRAIVWPERTHAPRDSAEVRSGKLLPWRSAAEIIDWSLPCPSIFSTKDEIHERYGISAVRPLPTQTAGGVFGCCKAVLCKIGTSERLYYWPQIRDLLNRYCGYALGTDDLLLLSIGGVLYYIADIGLRMLSPRELYNAMGFPPDYIIDHDAGGKPYPKTQQVARCGNAVCPPMAAAVVAANLPEYAVPGKIETMAALADAVAM